MHIFQVAVSDSLTLHLFSRCIYQKRLTPQKSKNKLNESKLFRLILYLMHLLQTVISNFEPLDDFDFNLSKLKVLNLFRQGEEKGSCIEVKL